MLIGCNCHALSQLIPGEFKPSLIQKCRTTPIYVGVARTLSFLSLDPCVLLTCVNKVILIVSTNSHHSQAKSGNNTQEHICEVV